MLWKKRVDFKVINGYLYIFIYNFKSILLLCKYFTTYI